MTAADPGDTARQRAALVWSNRCRFEREAARRFEMLARELQIAGASATVCELAREAHGDELRHAKLCVELCRHFGGQNEEAPPGLLRRVAPTDLEGSDALLYEVVAMCCVTETLNTALLGRLVERCTDKVTHKAMHSILRDEVQHSRLGWAYLAENDSDLPRRVIEQKLPGLLRATLGGVSITSESHPSDDELAGLGQLGAQERHAIVAQTLEQVIFIGLERFGISARGGREWLKRRGGDPS